MNDINKNLMAYDIYKALIYQGYNFAFFKDIDNMFELVYDYISIKEFGNAKIVLRDICEILGEDNPYIIRANTIIEFEMEIE